MSKRVTITDCIDCPCYTVREMLKECSLGYGSFRICKLNLITTDKFTYVTDRHTGWENK